MQQMSKCCGVPPSPLVVMVPKEKTCKVNKPALNIFNQYYMNKQQNKNNGYNNTIDFSASSKTAKSMGKDAVSKQSFMLKNT